LKLAEKLSKYGIKIIGTSFDALDLAEDRGRFSELLTELKFSHNLELQKRLMKLLLWRMYWTFHY
jgi:carbamoylphosphate synthase large subunit